jgi:hypothetical protein
MGKLSPLSAGDSMRLLELETVVERGLETFYEVGRALCEIRDRRLYRETHRKFEDYVRERWGWYRQRAYGYIEAARVVDNVRPTGHELPMLEHARRLASLSREEQRELAPVVKSMSTREMRKFLAEKKADKQAIASDGALRALDHDLVVVTGSSTGAIRAARCLRSAMRSLKNAFVLIHGSSFDKRGRERLLAHSASGGAARALVSAADSGPRA